MNQKAQLNIKFKIIQRKTNQKVIKNDNDELIV